MAMAIVCLKELRVEMEAALVGGTGFDKWQELTFADRHCLVQAEFEFFWDVYNIFEVDHECL